MHHADTLDRIRRTVRGVFTELTSSQELAISEHILIRSDQYCGRRFRCGAFEAVWFIEEDEIKVHGPDGAVVRVLAGAEPPAGCQDLERRAA